MQTQHQQRKARQVARFVLWPGALVCVFSDLPVLDGFDILLLLVLIVLETWAVVTACTIIRNCVAGALFALVFFSMSFYTPILRYVLSHRQPHDQEFADGAVAVIHALSPFRPYILLAALGLFAIGISPSRIGSSNNGAPEREPS